MKAIYKQIWALAKPYYEKGRPGDIDHIEWMMADALKVCAQEKIDETLLLPLVILHDVGYAEVNHSDPFNLDTRKAHMQAGAKIAKQILEKVNYPKEKIKKIVYYVSVHDNWAFGDKDIYKDKILGIFTDLDYTWMATPKGYKAMMNLLNKSKNEIINYLETAPKGVPFSSKTTKKLFEKYIAEL